MTKNLTEQYFNISLYLDNNNHFPRRNFYFYVLLDKYLLCVPNIPMEVERVKYSYVRVNVISIASCQGTLSILITNLV